MPIGLSSGVVCDFVIRKGSHKSVARCASQHRQCVAISKVADPSHKNRCGVWQQASHGSLRSRRAPSRGDLLCKVGAKRGAARLKLAATHARPNVPALFRANFAVLAGGR